MTRTEAVRVFAARANAVDRLLDRAARVDHATAIRLIAMAEIHARMADAAARIVAALPEQEG